MAVGPAADGDSQGVAVGEVDLGLAARWVLLREVDLLIRPVEARLLSLSKGPGRARHQRSCVVSDGSGPHYHFRADRSLIPAPTTAVCCVFPSILFCLKGGM